MKLLIINGPNLNMLGIREPEIYGNKTYWDLVWCVEVACKARNIECECFQSNHEGDIVEKIQRAYNNFDGIIINPAAYTHTSVALRDALAGVGIPFIEVHLSNVHAREPFRQHSYFSDLAIGVICGLGHEGYRLALEYLLNRINLD